MTKTFERFLRAFTDDELIAFAQDRGRVRPPYWKVLRLALQVEAGRRRLGSDADRGALFGTAAPSEERTGRASRPA
jgi:hypothetical protein